MAERFNIIEQQSLIRDVARLRDRIMKLEAILQGVPISTARIADAAITNAKIDSLTWDKGQGGILTLGGSANGDGVLNMKNGSDFLYAVFDKDGIKFYNSSSQNIITLGLNGLRLDTYTNGLIDFYNTSGQRIGLLRNAGAVFALESYNGTDIFITSNDDIQMTADQADGAIDITTTGRLFLESHTGNIVLRAIDGPSGVQTISLVAEKLDFFGTLTVNGSPKTAIVPTSKGYRALYTAESPDIWFFDFAKVNRPHWWEFWKKPEYIIDPLFLETVEGIDHIIPTMNKDVVQVWGKRKGYKDTRFQEKTKEQFNKNNDFWNTPNK